MFRGQMANILMVALLEILYSTYCYFLYSSMYNDKAYHKMHCGCHSKSHSPQCLQCHVDFEGFSQSHTSFISYTISIKTAFRQYESMKFYPLKHIQVLNNTTQRQMCTWNQIAMVIIKSEWLNLTLLETEG